MRIKGELFPAFAGLIKPIYRKSSGKRKIRTDMHRYGSTFFIFSPLTYKKPPNSG
ncbi:hypothetical protein RF007C_05425 [Ruminococcus flavefaciens 007c]|uniref:Uncharacterized protein n=1 Tax=Ruminococcus flavefaciens 007c TaxID=1341157 RepID=W7UVF0_RUMFL|nr:hypothetical protein RF007C_05425 [Ruminococcus flavefaciens 007c]